LNSECSTVYDNDITDNISSYKRLSLQKVAQIGLDDAIIESENESNENSCFNDFSS